MSTDTFTFIRELPKSFTEIGAVIPSSRWLGKALARPVKRATRPIKILEVGPGTGPITREILRFMGPEDELIVCELNEVFMDRLKKRLADNELFLKHKDRIRFLRAPVQQLGEEELSGTFDAIVSSLPFSNFQPEMVDEILELYRDLLAPEGTLTFCEYVGLRRISSMLRQPEERERAKAVEVVVKNWVDRWANYGEVKKGLTLLNVPPAMTLEFNHRVPPPR